MPVITIKTKVNASQEICFDLSRSIDLHTISTQHTGEQAVAGVVSGLIEMGESVSWRARHFGIWQHLTSCITEYDRPYLFVDEMVTGAFKQFRHTHRFESSGDGTILTDVFIYTSPLGVLGRLADWLFLKSYMTRLLKERNRVTKDYAESGKYIEVLAISRAVRTY